MRVKLGCTAPSNVTEQVRARKQTVESFLRRANRSNFSLPRPKANINGVNAIETKSRSKKLAYEDSYSRLFLPVFIGGQST